MDTTISNEIKRTSTCTWYIVTGSMAVKELFDLNPEPYEKYQYPALLMIHDNVLIICDYPILWKMFEGVKNALDVMIPAKAEE